MASWHRHYKPCPQGSPTYLTLLDAAGQVVELRPITGRERIASIRKWEIGAGDSFPAFNVPPLLEARNEKVKARMAEFKKCLIGKKPPDNAWIERRLRRLVLLSKSCWAKPGKAEKGRNERDKVNKCLTVLPPRLGELLGPPPPSHVAIKDLIDRSQTLSADTLFEQIERWLIARVRHSPADSGEWLDILFFHSGKTPKKVSLILELSDRSKFEYPANHEAISTWINSRLHANDDAKRVAQADPTGTTTDAYANAAVGLSDSFPSVRLLVLGNVILRSMSSESPCQKRYGYAEAASCPVGQVTRQEMKNALEWIGHPERRAKTWSDVSSLTGVTSVLFAYPVQTPDVSPALAGLIVGMNALSDPDGARFEACAKRVTEALKGKTLESSAEVRVFVLSKPDGFRTKVLCGCRYTVDHLLQCAEEWEHAARNIPMVEIRQLGLKKGDKASWVAPVTPFPGEVVGCLNTAWERAGSHAKAVSGFGIGDGLGLLLERRPTLHAIAVRAIRTLVSNSLSLVLALGQAHHQGRAHSLAKKYGKHPLLLPSILGLLLAKLGRWKGEYMKGPPFLIGRLLSLADQLHVQYCHGVRKGQIPPQLVGNALMATALEQPTKALAVLSQRILPYHAWARTLQGGDEVRLVKYFLGELGRMSTELKELELPTKCNDADKAEMLLGYLARSEKDKEPEPTTVAPEDSDKEQPHE